MYGPLLPASRRLGWASRGRGNYSPLRQTRTAVAHCIEDAGLDIQRKRSNEAEEEEDPGSHTEQEKENRSDSLWRYQRPGSRLCGCALCDERLEVGSCGPNILTIVYPPLAPVSAAPLCG